MAKPSERHFFLGGNTPDGFYSYYDYILPQKEAKRIYCIKGGPGTGKSSFMKNIASQMKDYDIEYMHCSSDPNSLDGVVIKNLGIAFVDGTSPHIVDPKNPGAVDEIINLGACWTDGSMIQNKDAIISINASIGEHFKRAYAYLAAAKEIDRDIELIMSRSINPSVHSIYVDSIVMQEFAEMGIAENEGEVRKLFASAITPDGVVNYLDTVFDGLKVHVIKGYAGNVLNTIAEKATVCGLDVEKYYCPFSPSSKCEHLVIPELKLAFSTSNEYHSYESDEMVDFDGFTIEAVKEKYAGILEYDLNMKKQLIDKAIETIKGAKALHDILEEYYIPNMDFSKVDEILLKCISDISM